MSSLSSVIKGPAIAWSSPELLTVELTLLEHQPAPSIDPDDAAEETFAGERNAHLTGPEGRAWITRVKEAQDEAQAILDKAREEAEQYLKEAREQWEKEKQDKERALEEVSKRLYEEARKEGFAAGYQEGKERAEKELQERSETLWQAFLERYEQLDHAFQQDVNDAYEQLFTLAFEIAEKLTFQALKDDERLVAFAKEALTKAPYSETLKIALSPQDYSRLIPYRNELKKLLPEHTRLIMYPNIELTDGLFIESESGIVDLDFAQQLKRYVRDLKEATRA
ncbi:MAG: hypothetical protein IMX04_02395 [Candidatus Carbobacillus altaicus]|nr:hypothetical protein [Candidatus Carbobacillus altaicus]